jgi:hypothetical protein
VDHIAKMMRGLTWKRGESVRALSAAWGLCEKRIRELSAEASKVVRAEIADPDTVQTTVCAALDWAIHDAKKRGKHMAVARAGKVWSDITGATAARKVDVRVGAGEGQVELPADPGERAAIWRAMAELEEGK